MGTLKTGERLGRNGLQQIKKKILLLSRSRKFSIAYLECCSLLRELIHNANL
jgi:hypothetical protein